MLLASIDVGSTTVRLLVAEVAGCEIQAIRYEYAITRLSRGLNATGRLSLQAMQETIGVLHSFKNIIEASHVTQIISAGTGALREAGNTSEFVRGVFEQTGLAVEVITGLREAEITGLGVISSLPDARKAAILDIGGSSTEIIIVRGGKTLFRRSIPVGVVRLLEQYVTNDPPTADELVAVKSEADRVGEELAENVLNFIDKETIFISTAGTPTTLAAMDLGLYEYDHQRVHGHQMRIERLQEMFNALAKVTIGERVGMGCLDPRRADLIIPGLALTIGIMKAFAFCEMMVSDHGLLEGLLLQASGCGY